MNNKRIIDLVDKQAKEKALKFKEEINKGKYKKITLPNSYVEYPLDKALESFKKLNKSKIIDKAINKCINK